MAEATKTQTNGTPKNGKAKNGTATATKKEAQAETKNGQVSGHTIEKAKPLPIGDRVEKVERLQKLVDKRKQVLDVKRELEDFSVQSDSMNCRIRLEDANGHTFTTSQPAIIEACLQNCREVVAKKLQEVETEINF